MDIISALFSQFHQSHQLVQLVQFNNQPARNATPARSDAASSGKHSVAGGQLTISDISQLDFPTERE